LSLDGAEPTGEINMPYGYLILIATGVLAVRHIRSTCASSRSKYLVGGLAAFTVLAPYLWPRFLPLAGWVSMVSMYLQLAICFYIIFHQAVYDDESDRALRQPASSRKSKMTEL
jgi:hypothetical protein